MRPQPRPARDRADLVAEHREVARRGDARVLLAQAAGRGVAGVGEQSFARRALTPVELLERRERHEHLAPHLELRRHPLPLEAIGYRRDRAEILGDVLARAAVAARRPDGEATLLVLQGDGEAVELGLGDEAQRAGHQPLDARAPRDQLVARERVVERQHRGAVLDGRKRRHRSTTGPLCGRIRSDQLRVRALQLAQLLDERVELGVGNLGRVEDEVLLVVVFDQLPQLLHTFGALARSPLAGTVVGGCLLRARHAPQSTERVRRRRRSGADGELRGGTVVVHTTADLACEQQRALGLARAVAGQPARGCDQRL